MINGPLPGQSWDSIHELEKLFDRPLSLYDGETVEEVELDDDLLLFDPMEPPPVVDDLVDDPLWVATLEE